MRAEGCVLYLAENEFVTVGGPGHGPHAQGPIEGLIGERQTALLLLCFHALIYTQPAK
jgi:hypothetical protein